MRPRIDAHVHVWGDGVVHPFSPTVDHPAPTTTATVHELLREGASDLRGLLAIQPSQYGLRHDYLLDAIASLPQDAPEVRAMPLVEPASTPVSQVLEHAGSPVVAGVRVVARGRRGVHALDPEAGAELWQLAAQLDMTVGVLLDPDRLPELQALLRRLPGLTVIVDHVARLRPGAPDHRARLVTLLELAEHPGVHVKLSALDALSAEPPPHGDMTSTVEAVLSRFGADRCLYGSDWPYRRAFGPYRTAPDALLAAIAAIAGVDEPADVVADLDATAARVLGFGTRTLSR